MRKLMWFVIGFGFACGVCAYGMTTVWFLPGALLAVIVSVAAVIPGKRRKFFHPAIAVLAGCIVGLGWFGLYHLVYLRPVTALDGQEITLTITASDYSRETDYGAVVDGVAIIEGKPYQLWVYLTEQTPLQPGDILEGNFRIRLTTYKGSSAGRYLGPGL